MPKFSALRNALGIWNQFCEFTSIAGFRFMTTKITFPIRVTAFTIFCASVVGLTVQITYLITQHLQQRQVISTFQSRMETVPLPYIFICQSLYASTSFDSSTKGNVSKTIPWEDICRSTLQNLWNETYVDEWTKNGSESFDDFKHFLVSQENEKLRQLFVPYCAFNVVVNYECVFQCRWTSNGYCIQVSVGEEREEQAPEDKRGLDPLDEDGVRSFEIPMFVNVSEEIALIVYLRTKRDAHVADGSLGERGPSVVPLIGAPHVTIDSNELNLVQVVEILSTARTASDAPKTNVSYEFCVWRHYSRLLSFGSVDFNGTVEDQHLYNAMIVDDNASGCEERLYAGLYDFNASLEAVRFGAFQCSIKIASEAAKFCDQIDPFLKYKVETSTLDRSVIDGDAAEISSGDDVDELRLHPNFNVFMKEVYLSETLISPRSQQWKILSELGGSLSLYIGFTVMSVFEIIAFLAVPKVRKHAQQDEETLMERKNPPIKNFTSLFRSIRTGMGFWRVAKLPSSKVEPASKNMEVKVVAFEGTTATQKEA